MTKEGTASREFPGCRVVWTVGFHCYGPGSVPRQGIDVCIQLRGRTRKRNTKIPVLKLDCLSYPREEGSALRVTDKNTGSGLKAVWLRIPDLALSSCAGDLTSLCLGFLVNETGAVIRLL